MSRLRTRFSASTAKRNFSCSHSESLEGARLPLLHDLACKALLLMAYAIVVGQSYKTNAKAFHHTLSLSHTCSAWRRTSHFQNHHERSAQRKCASKARKNSTSWPWNRRSCGPKFGPRSGPRRKYTHTRKTVSQNLISAVVRLLGGFKNEPRKWTRFGGRLSQTRGQKKGSAWVAP